MDLALELMNTILKMVALKLGPNATNHKCIDTYCKAIDVSKAILEKFDYHCDVIHRSGKHVVKSDVSDLEKIVFELPTQKAFKWTPGCCYSHYKNMKSSIIEDNYRQDVFQWINKHKKNIAMGKKAR